jgi:arginine/ornithine transport system substrate-binding protein
MTRRGMVGAVGVAMLLGALVSSSMARAQDQTIRVATEASFPPFSKTEADGSYSGFEIDLGTAICAHAKLDCHWIKQDFSGFIAGLNAGKYNMIFSSMSITDERKKVVDFSIPYYNTPYRFVEPKGANVEISNSGLRGKKVGVYAGATQEKYLKAKYAGVVEPRGYQSMDQINADLVAGRVDLAFNEELAGAEFLKTPAGQNFEFVGPEIQDPQIFGVGVGVVFRKGDDALRNKINDAIRAVYGDGTFDSLSAKYFGTVNIRADKSW